MKKGSYSKNVWKYLINQLSKEQKLEIIKNQDLKLGNMQTKLLTNESQWKMAVKLLETNYTQIKIQKVIVDYYMNNIVPELSEDMENEEKSEEFERIIDMSIENLQKVTEERGFIYVLMFFVQKNNLEKANEIIENIPNEIEKEVATEDISKELKERLELAEKENQYLNKKVKNLTDKIEKQKVAIQELGRENKELLHRQKEIETEYDRKLYLLMKQIDDHIIEIDKLKTDKNNYQHISEIRQNRIYELEVEKEQILEQNKNNLFKKEIQERPWGISLEPKESFEISSSMNILVFGDLPFTTQRHNPNYKFSYFNGDYLNYDFNDSYDEYWYVADKLSMKEKRQLDKNVHAKKIAWVRKTYNGEMNKKYKAEEYTL